MIPLERRNEPQMLRQFWKKYPRYNLSGAMRKRYEELMDAKAFNAWLQDRNLRQEGRRFEDEAGRTLEQVNARVPQLRWAPAERAGVLNAAAQVRRSAGSWASARAPSARRCWPTSRKASR